MAKKKPAAKSGSRASGDHLKLRNLLFGMAPDVYGRPSDPIVLPKWPPDVFALIGSVAEVTGCYVRWMSSMSRKDWESQPGRIKRLGRAWRRQFNGEDLNGHSGKEKREHARSLKELDDAWETLKNGDDVALIDLTQDGHDALRSSMYLLFAAADEACEGVGRLVRSENDRMLFTAEKLLTVGKDDENYSRVGSSLCSRDVTQATMRVLPKHLTPQGGLTLRSLSRNLALCASTSVKSYWYGFPASTKPARRSLNLLVIPWPFVVRPLQFVASEPSGELVGETDTDRFFQYQIPVGDLTPTGEPVVKVFTEILKAAKDSDGQVDGIILPELAVAADVYPHLERIAKESECFLICGVGAAPPERAATGPRKSESPKSLGGRNELRCDFPFSHEYAEDLVPWSRSKHHRWRLDRSQIIQYGLGGRLHTQYNWWEHISLPDRRLGFFGAAADFALCALICEDLAQQDPVAGLVRAVGPNLVIALLMDGPQLAQRWSGRYASVLADDPGSSILTVTSLGMTKLSRPPGLSEPSRIVALWKDAFSGAQPIELPRGNCACLLHLSLEEKPQRTADGRTGVGVYPILGGVHFVPNVESLQGVDV